MTTFSMKGRVKHVGDTNRVTDTFKKRELVILKEGPNENPIRFEFKQDNVNRLDGVTTGENVEVFFYIDGREWNGKYFVNLTGAKVERITPEPVNNRTSGGGLPF